MGNRKSEMENRACAKPGVLAPFYSPFSIPHSRMS
jgi:hypothetical protein